MISGIGKILTSNSLNNITSNTNSQVMLETTLKSIGRPGFILIDNEINEDTKRYAATKEFLYQATCLLIYATLVVPVFKRGAFKLAQKIFDKALNNLALASWTKFRANRLENATEAAMTRAEKAAKTWAAKQMTTGDSEHPVDYTESPAYQRILEQKQEFDRQPTAEETLNLLKQVREQYQDAKKAGTDKDFKIQNTDTKDYADTVKLVLCGHLHNSVSSQIKGVVPIISGFSTNWGEDILEPNKTEPNRDTSRPLAYLIHRIKDGNVSSYTVTVK